MLLADLSQLLHDFARPVHDAPWSDVRDFWLKLVLDDRFVVVYFLPLVPALMLLRGRALRVGLLVASLLFITYLFGVLYAGLWLATCVALWRLSERFAVECRRTDVLPIGPPLAAWSIVGGWYAVTMLLHKLVLPEDLNAWLHTHVSWIYPLGARGWPWEPFIHRIALYENRPPPLIHALFWDPHYIGTAYLAVRMLHYFSEIKAGRLLPERRTLLNFLSYTCYGPLLIQGPIERFDRFHEEIETCHARRGPSMAAYGLWRITMGLAKSVVVTLWFLPLFWYEFRLGTTERFWRHPEEIQSFGLLYFGVFLIIFSLYLEFSGYCDIAVGIGRLLGYRTVENFAMPWLATSLRDFWRRWHITLSAILRDYIYIPLGGGRSRTTRNLCITFIAIGLWHQLVLQVVVWGLIMGLMLAVNQRWAAWMKRLDARPAGLLPAIRRGAVRLRPLPTIVSWLVTQHAFVFSLLVFFGGAGAINVLREIFRRLLAH